MLFPRIRSACVHVDGSTLAQGGTPLAWDEHGYYAVALDANSSMLTP